MALKFYCILISFFLLLTVPLSAQSVKSDSASQQKTPLTLDKTDNIPLNFVKLNLPGILLNNYSLQYERVLNKRFSVALAYRIMPSTGIPFKDLVFEEAVEEGVDAEESEQTIQDIKVRGSAITPEVRLYVGKKGYGRGFYLAPFYRRANFKTNSLTVTYEDEDGVNGENTLNLSGKFTSNTGGLMMGAQWALGKYMCLDWWILGVHAGSGTGTFEGKSIRNLTQSEQEDLRQELNDLDIPFADKTVTVNANNASLKLEGPWGGIRGGLSLGVKF